MLRTILGVIAGFILWSMVWLAGGQYAQLAFPEALAEDGSTSHLGYLVSLVALSVVASVLAGSVARLVSRTRQMTPELILGVLLLIAGVGIETGYWELLPLWYHAAFLVLLLPATLLGGRLGQRG
jgi:hypothetical protein